MTTSIAGEDFDDEVGKDLAPELFYLVSDTTAPLSRIS